MKDEPAVRNLTRWTALLLAGLVSCCAAAAAMAWVELNPGWIADFRSLNPKSSVRPAIEQIYVSTAGRADRCVTCHLLADVAAKNEYHRAHPVTVFGCTICHDANGRSLRVSEAHLIPDRRTPRVGLLEAARSSCTMCHSQRYTTAKTGGPDEGRILVSRLGCAECHSVPDLYTASDRLDLTTLVQKLRREYLVSLLIATEPRTTITRGMPYYSFTTGQARDISEYLHGTARYRETPTPVARMGTAEGGKNIFSRLGCLRCHVTADYSGGGDTGPVLVGLGERFTRSWVEWWLRDPRTLRPMSEMPVYHLKDAEIADLVAYLGGGYGADPYAGLDAPGDAEAGRKLFDDNYCLACHTTDGRALGRKIGPPLDGIASRTPARIPFKDLPAGALDAQTKLDRLAKYLSDVRGFEKVAQRTIAMPNFKLAQKDREPIALFLLSLRSGQLPREMISASPYRKDELRGEILFQRRTCHLCHNIEEITPGLSRAEGMKTSGRIQGPNLFVIGGKVRSGWLPDWLAHPQGVLLNPKMPDPMLAPQDIADLSSYLKMLTAADFELPIALPPADAEVISAGEGFCRGVCYKCHTINGSGVVFGPDLSDIGIKVRPQFIIRWLYRAGDIQPDTAMEDLFIPRDRALIIFRYLETLKQRPR